MSAKHTPGPWIAAARPSSIVGWPIVGPMGRMVCDVAIINRQGAGSDEKFKAYYAEIEANAHLIAAAPELLECARDGLASLEAQLALILESHCKLDADLEPKRDTLDDDVRDVVEELEGKIDRARAIIAKATGEA